MNELVVADRTSEWRRLKALVLDSVSSPITWRVYNLSLDEFIAWYTEAPRPAGFTKATVSAWRVRLESRGLGRFRSMFESPLSGSRRSRRTTTALWRQNWAMFATLLGAGCAVPN